MSTEGAVEAAGEAPREFRDEQLLGATFDHVDLSGSRWNRVDLSGSTLRSVDFARVEMRNVARSSISPTSLMSGTLEQPTP